MTMRCPQCGRFMKSTPDEKYGNVYYSPCAKCDVVYKSTVRTWFDENNEFDYDITHCPIRDNK